MLGILYRAKDKMVSKTWSRVLNSSQSAGDGHVKKKFKLWDVFQVKV